MGSSSKASKSKKRELSDHALTLRKRLHEALSLGIITYDKKGRKWHCKDAEIQSHALRTMSAFISYISSTLLQHPLIKDSIFDMLVALEGILQSDNERILSLAGSVTVNLVNFVGTSIRYYHVSEVIFRLSHLLSLHQLPVQVSSAQALNHILTNLGPVRYGNQKEVWEIVEKTNIVGSVICAIQDYEDGVQPHEVFTEMSSLLRTILWRWPPSRYHAWSNSKLMAKLINSFANPDASFAICVLQLCSAVALCSNGAMVLLESKKCLSKMVHGMGALRAYNVQYESLMLCQHLMRSVKPWSILTSFYCEPIVQGIVLAMGGWRSYSKNLPSDQLLLVRESCRTAIIISRYAGDHHLYFWKHEIDGVLLDILTGNCCSFARSKCILSSEALLPIIYDNNTYTRSYVWDILGYLAVHCNEDFLPEFKGNLCFLDILISSACAVTKYLMHKGHNSSYISELELVSRAVLLMVFSPCKYIASQARYYLLDMLRNFGDGHLGHLLASMKLYATGDVSLVSDMHQTVINLTFMVCYSVLPQYQKGIVEKKGIHVLSAILKRCLNSDMHFSRASIDFHLHNSSDGRTCCLNTADDWEGGNIPLFLSLQALSQLIVFCNVACNHHGKALRESILCMTCATSEAPGLEDSLQYVLDNSFSPGAKWYAAYVLSFFGYYGFPSELGTRMKRVLGENEVADLKLILPNGQYFRVHGAVLVARCPSLLPPEKFSKEGASTSGSTRTEEIDQHGRSKDEIRMSDRVDRGALLKILEYVYAGILHVDYDLIKPLKILAKHCGLKSLSDMLRRKLPKWGMPILSCDLTRALEPNGYTFTDIILEAKSTGVASNCSICHLTMPHMHAHKIVLWASCDYLRALFQSGMHDSYSQIVNVPIGWLALVKLVRWFYSGELPRISTDCLWNNMTADQQLQELKAYVELSSLAEYWLLEEVGEDSLNAVVSCLKSSQKISIEIIQFAADLSQWKIVKAAIISIAPLYPKIRKDGDLENLDEEMVDMLRAEYVRHCQVDGD